MIRSSNSIVRLLSSHLIRDSCKSIYQGVFHRVIGGGGVGRLHVINLNNQVLPNTSIRGLASMPRDDDDDDDDDEDDDVIDPKGDYAIYAEEDDVVDDVDDVIDPDDDYTIDDEGMSDEERFQLTEADFQRGFKDYCKKRGKTFSSEVDKLNMFKWYRAHYIYARDFPCNRGWKSRWEKLRCANLLDAM
ncbi:hypothetical protein TSUD_315720 [Trifolium subterraneum]|uniref:Cathepsin propeptide inhibitor domain-containing protein n=1 Tax=Trifolium subterraneum TaxID=3900 RepID=A0A2Z6MGW5_TRISU|nr:hypothetical protein TSUD_315720 [Trifolium subterraneum]